MSYPLEPIDLLVDVSNVLYNERIVEQRKQINELKKNNENLKQKIDSILCHKYLIKFNNKEYYILSSICDCEILFHKIFDNDILFDKNLIIIIRKFFDNVFNDSDENYVMGGETYKYNVYGTITYRYKNELTKQLSINLIHNFPINTTDIIEVY